MVERIGTDNPDRLDGTFARDLLDGRGGNDTLLGLQGGDVLLGGDGNDYLDGAAGDDSLDGGLGNDVLRPGSNVFEDTIRGGEGSDVIDFVGATTFSYYYLTYYDLARSGAGWGINATITATGGTVRKAIGGADTLRNLALLDSARDDVLFFEGTRGNDSITITAGPGRFVSVAGGAGRDTVTGGADSHEMLTLFGTDRGFDVTVTASAGGQMTGSATSTDSSGQTTTTTFRNIDMIAGSSNDDVFVGSAGNDNFYGRNGHDAFDGGAGFDTIHYNLSRNILSVFADLQTGELVERVDVNGRTSTFSESAVRIEGIVGSRNSDTLYGNVLGNRLDGERGGDFIDGRAGNDTLIGGSGDDRLIGGDGDDSLVGGTFDDTLSGGAGADRFSFGNDDGWDRVADFTDGLDRIVITSGAASFAEVSVDDWGPHVRILFADTTVILARIDPALITAADFEFV